MRIFSRVCTLFSALALFTVLSLTPALASPAGTPAEETLQTTRSVPMATTTVDKGEFLLKYSLDSTARRVDVSIEVGTDYTLNTDRDGSDLRISSASSRELVEVLSLQEILEAEGVEDVDITAWKTSGTQSATVSLSAAAVREAQRDHVETFGAHDAWYNCMSEHGISGAVAGAVAGCAVAIEIGCVEGAVTGWTSGGIAGLVSGLFACRSKW